MPVIDAKKYTFACPYNFTNGAWNRCIPSTSGSGNPDDIELQVQLYGGSGVKFRVVHSNPAVASTVTVNIGCSYPQNDIPSITNNTANAQYTDASWSTYAFAPTSQVIQTGGNVGVGTLTPAYKLDVTGVIRTSSNLLVGGTASFGGTTNSLFSVAASGGASLNMGAGVNSKILSLYDQGTGDAIASASNFYGFGVNANTLRYQVPSATTNHTFYCGGAQAANFTSGQATFNGQVTSVSVTSSNVTASTMTSNDIIA